MNLSLIQQTVHRTPLHLPISWQFLSFYCESLCNRRRKWRQI